MNEFITSVCGVCVVEDFVAFYREVKLQQSADKKLFLVKKSDRPDL